MKIIGHRGAKGLAPENTLASFKKALACHVDSIELDVQLTKDSVLVCSHDATIVAKGGKWLAIPRSTHAELLAQKPDLITLDQAIEYIARRVPIVIEIKESAPSSAVIERIRYFLDKGWQMNDFEFCSFLLMPLVDLRTAFPDATLIPNDEWSSIRACMRAHRLQSRRISINERWLWRGYLRILSAQGWDVSSYTVNNVARARTWAPYLYAVYTDYPDRFKQR